MTKEQLIARIIESLGAVDDEERIPDSLQWLWDLEQPEPKVQLSPSESVSFYKTLSRSPRRIT